MGSSAILQNIVENRLENAACTRYGGVIRGGDAVTQAWSMGGDGGEQLREVDTGWVDEGRPRGLALPDALQCSEADELDRWVG